MDTTDINKEHTQTPKPTRLALPCIHTGPKDYGPDPEGGAKPQQSRHETTIQASPHHPENASKQSPRDSKTQRGPGGAKRDSESGQEKPRNPGKYPQPTRTPSPKTRTPKPTKTQSPRNQNPNPPRDPNLQRPEKKQTEGRKPQLSAGQAGSSQLGSRLTPPDVHMAFARSRPQVTSLAEGIVGHAFELKPPGATQDHFATKILRYVGAGMMCRELLAFALPNNTPRSHFMQFCKRVLW